MRQALLLELASWWSLSGQKGKKRICAVVDLVVECGSFHVITSSLQAKN